LTAWIERIILFIPNGLNKLGWPFNLTRKEDFMKALNALSWLVGILIGTSTSISFAQVADLAKERAAIIQTDNNWLAVSKNATAFVAATDPNFKLFPPNAPLIENRIEIEKFWRSFVETPGLSVVWAPKGAEVAKSGDLGYSFGSYTLKTGIGTSDAKESSGKYVTIMRKQANGSWAPAVDIFNPDK
jgi:ketosteroid isomerase-like protein